MRRVWSERSGWRAWPALAILVLAAACTTKQQNKCTVDGDCTNPAYPFCDVNGEFSTSDGEKNVCTIVPPDCPVERCGCSPGAKSCTDDTLSTCDPGGASKSATTCVFGCASDGTRCLSFAPSNGLGPAFVASAAEPDIELPSGSHINTDTGAVTDGASIPIQVSSLLVTQGSSSIRVFIGNSMTIGDITVKGSSALAIVAADTIEVSGNILARASGTLTGPGGQETGACVGGPKEAGGGGGGNATAGGAGALPSAVTPPGAGGMPITGFEPLVGGCRGGGQTDSNGTVVVNGGAGGGAVQLVAGTSIAITGSIDVGGGGGGAAAGGGSGGVIVLQSPHVSFAGGLWANGGGGGGCALSGADGSADSMAAPGGGPCGSLGTYQDGGAGGTGTSVCTAGTARLGASAGGGGAVGRIQVVNLDGTFDTSSGMISAALTTSQLQPM